MRQAQHKGLLRVLSIAALVLGLVSMHHLATAQCDPADHAQLTASAPINNESSAASHDGRQLQVSPSFEQASQHSHKDLLLGCMCLIVMCLAIIALITRLLLRPDLGRASIMVCATPRPMAFIQNLLPRPPNLFALSVLRT